MVDFVRAIKRPFTDFKKLGIGVLIYLVTIIPFIGWLASFFITGYGLECAKTSMKKNYKLPEWTDWGNLWIKGFLYSLIGLIYMIPLVLIGAFTIGSALIKNWALLTAPNPDPIALASAFGGTAGVWWLLLLIMIVTLYIVPMAIMRFVESGKFGDAFNFREVFRKAFTSRYFAAFILLGLYIFAVTIIASLLSLITAITVILPLIITTVLSFVIAVTSMTVFGEVYSEIK